MTPQSQVGYRQDAFHRRDDPVHARFSTFGHIRCECRRCGNQLYALAIDNRLTGECGNCGSGEIAAVEG